MGGDSPGWLHQFYNLVIRWLFGIAGNYASTDIKGFPFVLHENENSKLSVYPLNLMQPGLFCCQTADSCYFHLLCSNATEGGKAMAQQKKGRKKIKEKLKLGFSFEKNSKFKQEKLVLRSNTTVRMDWGMAGGSTWSGLCHVAAAAWTLWFV